MKKLLCLIFSFLVVSSNVYAVDAEASIASRKAMDASVSKLRTVCQRVRSGFRYEFNFINFFSYECSFYETRRIPTRDAIFPLTNNIQEGYNEQYPKLSSDFVLELDKRQIEYYKMLVENYCKYNTSRMKEPAACSAASIKNYFDI